MELYWIVYDNDYNSENLHLRLNQKGSVVKPDIYKKGYMDSICSLGDECFSNVSVISDNYSNEVFKMYINTSRILNDIFFK